jgi:uncharacterized protein YbjQ (UPF0145 family)
MWPFRRRDQAQERRSRESLEAIEAGGLPLAASHRLEEVRQENRFSSDLSVAEFLLIREAGFHPVTQVMGSCFYRVGWQWMPGGMAISSGNWQGTWDAGQTVELETQTEAWNEARGRALARLAEEARRAGADAVVGVRLERGRYDWAAGLIEFIALGTAVRSERYELGSGPVLSNLSGQEFAKLFAHGWWPVGLVAGSTVSYVMSGWTQQWRSRTFLGSFQNQELPDFTRGFYEARTQAMMRATRGAHELGAHGLVGVRFDHAQRTHESNRGGRDTIDLIIEMHVLGTAVVELDRRDAAPGVCTALSLDRGAP